MKIVLVFGLLGVALSEELVASVASESASPCAKKTYQYTLVPKSDCTGYYVCFMGQTVQMQDCDEDYVFSSSVHSCVKKCSVDDDCATSSCSPRTCEEGAKAVPHPTACHLFYSCHSKYKGRVLKCRYPSLFSAKKERCDHFENVDCGNRKEYISECDKPESQCKGAHCRPCKYHAPSCKGLPDGPNPDVSRPWTPLYIICYKEHTLARQTCGRGRNSRLQYVFSPNERKCVSIDFMPKYMPDCTEKEDGQYADAMKRCNHYAVCSNGTYVGAEMCKLGSVFDAKSQDCLAPNEACKPCGRIEC